MDQANPMESSAVVDMEALDGDESDYEVNFSDPQLNEPKQTSNRKSDPGMMEDIKGEVTKNMTSYMFEAGKERAKKAFNIYGNIDVLRPYFDVEPHEVRQRIIHSLIPQKPNADVQQRVHRELYGPLMIVFTLIAVLLFQMKMSDHNIEEGTLMGTAFGVCFGYWFGVSSLIWVLAYVCNTHITILQILSMLGYSLFGHCVVLFLGTLFHTTHDHVMFYLLWAAFGGLSTVKMVTILMSRTAGKTQKLIVCGSVATFHLLFLLYLHFAYHQIVEGISNAIEKPDIPYAKQNMITERKVIENNVEKVNIENPAQKLSSSDDAVKMVGQNNEVKRSIRSVQQRGPTEMKSTTVLKQNVISKVSKQPTLIKKLVKSDGKPPESVQQKVVAPDQQHAKKLSVSAAKAH